MAADVKIEMLSISQKDEVNSCKVTNGIISILSEVFHIFNFPKSLHVTREGAWAIVQGSTPQPLFTFPPVLVSESKQPNPKLKHGPSALFHRALLPSFTTQQQHHNSIFPSINSINRFPIN